MVRAKSAVSIYRPGLFNGKVALVTGGGTGIGKCIAHELVLLGCKVVIAFRNLKRLHEAADAIRHQLRASGHDTTDCIYSVQCDIRNKAQMHPTGLVVASLVDQTLAKFRRIDFLVNNAGGQFGALAEDMTLKGWEAVIRTNLTGTFIVTKKVYHSYMKKHGGSIVNIILVMDNGYPAMSHSAAARAGIENLTKSLAVEWASSGIQLNCVAPGIILSSGVDNYDGGTEMFKYAAERSTVSKRMGSVEEVAAAVLYYLSSAAAYTTGTTLHVDGGWHLLGPLLDVPSHTNNAEYPGYGRCKL